MIGQSNCDLYYCATRDKRRQIWQNLHFCGVGHHFAHWVNERMAETMTKPHYVTALLIGRTGQLIVKSGFIARPPWLVQAALSTTLTFRDLNVWPLL